MKMILFSCFFLVTLSAQSSIQIDQSDPSQACEANPPTCSSNPVCVGEGKSVLCEVSNGSCIAVGKAHDILFQQCCSCGTKSNPKTENKYTS